MVDVMTRGRLAGALLLVGSVAVAPRPGAGLARVVDGAWVVAQAMLKACGAVVITLLESVERAPSAPPTRAEARAAQEPLAWTPAELKRLSDTRR
jgi:hypothetical protein